MMSDPNKIDAVIGELREHITRHVSTHPKWYGTLTIKVQAKNGVLIGGETDVHIVDTCKRSTPSKAP